MWLGEEPASVGQVWEYRGISWNESVVIVLLKEFDEKGDFLVYCLHARDAGSRPRTGEFDVCFVNPITYLRIA